MDFEAEYLAFIAAARARNEKLGLSLSKTRKRIKIAGAQHSSYQVHHIFPKHSGGPNTLDNVVALMPDEHKTAHFLYNMIVLQRVNKNQKRLKPDEYSFSMFHLQSIIKFIPNLLQSLVVTYNFKRNGIKDCLTAPIGDIAKFICVLKNKRASEPRDYLMSAFRIIQACFSEKHKLNVCEWHGKARFADLNFAA